LVVGWIDADKRVQLGVDVDGGLVVDVWSDDEDPRSFDRLEGHDDPQGAGEVPDAE
jgi:hypothetical protein